MTTLKIAIEVTQGQVPPYDEGSVVHARDTEKGTFPAHESMDITYTVLPDVSWELAVAERRPNLCNVCKAYTQN
ncbi:hypothetical protein E5083_17225 [Streptomyces bauhiniae]|uniref:Uncharacterized protein n=1 Tax=Streptomyces bauhiniae TaxID=2340725 RepID=A0A4Z1D272_9ACTN|nr:hypothetical protein [Streptomyces bauhiniae]TGN75442.1 hypothetical protein E5083_17225 [Streptomyces bauhiniae]